MQKKLIILLAALSAFAIAQACQVRKPSVPTKDWWETAQFYQIYPRSFKDSDGDGVGDLNGITSKLQYLKDIGVTATWLSPIFKSPMADFGYDISDFYAIDPIFGTMKDFENLIAEAKKIGIKIILDFVPNHSSDEADWFKKSVKRDPQYEDFYVWADGIDDPDKPGKKLPPSNWLAAFRGSAWEYVEERKQFYLHQFHKKQPDLDYRNPKVVERMNNVMLFWLDKGVDGFRVDAVPNVFEVDKLPDGSYPDEPKSGATDDPEDNAYLSHIYTQNQPETIQLVYGWRKLFDDYKRIHHTESKVLLIETYAPPDYTMQFYGNNSIDGAHLPFNFNLITQLDQTKLNRNMTAKDLKSVVDSWLTKMPSKRTANWVIGNHDQKRVSTRFGVEKVDHMNMLVMILPGASITYQGEELGMLDGDISWEDTRDPAACNSNENIYKKFSRDPSRTPFPWDDTATAGFSKNKTTWLPLAPNHKTLNVETEKKAARSHLKIYLDLVKLRKSDILRFGSYKYDAITDDVFAVLRSYKSEKTNKQIILVENFSNKKQTVDLTSRFKEVSQKLKLTIKSLNSTRSDADQIDAKKLVLAEYEAIVLSN